MRDGVAPSRVYLAPGPWATVLDFLHERYAHLPPGLLQDRLARGEIVDGQGRPVRTDTPYRPHQWLWYYRQVHDEPRVPFELPVLYQDERLVVVDKPHFMASTPGGRYLRETVLSRLRDALDLPDLSPIHRLDRDTAGVLMLCASRRHRGMYQSLFQRQEVGKEYEAIAPQAPGLRFPMVWRIRMVPGTEFLMTRAEGEPNSETHITLDRTVADGLALYRLSPVTGRKHQLRLHMSTLGIPIVNDELYPQLQPQRAADDFGRPLQLLARHLRFRDPVTGKQHCFTSRRRLLLDDAAG